MKVVRFLLMVALIVLAFAYDGYAQVSRYAVASTAWNNTNTWSDTPGGAPGFSVPTGIDDVFTEGFSVSIPTGSFSCSNLYVAYNVVNGINFGLGSPILTINGELAAYDPAIPDYAIPTVAIIKNNTSNLNLIFTGVNGAAIINPLGWGTNAPLRRVTFNPGNGVTVDIPDLVITSSGALTVQSGTLNVTGALQSNAASGTITVNSNANILVSSGGTISGGTNSTKFPTLTINGTITSQSNTTSYINADVINLNSGSNFNVGYNGSDQTQGWWYQSISPSSFIPDASSTVTYNSSTSQNIFSQGYGFLALGGTGTLTKTVAGGGSLNIKGNLTFNNTSITLTVPSASQVIFDGTGPQSINGGGTANFNGGLQMNKSSGTFFLSQSISIQNGLTLTAGTLDVGTNTINLSGNLVNNAFFTALSSTLVINGTTTISGGSTTSLNNLTISGSGILTAPSLLNIAGDFSNSGTFNRAAGTVVFNGSVDQSILGSGTTTFQDITVSKTSNTLTFSSNANLVGALSMTSGILDANGRLTFLSTASGDARVAQITGGSITGNVIAQRRLPNSSGSRAYRFIAPSVTGAMASDWKNEFPITGTFNDPSTQAEWPGLTSPPITQAAPSMYDYNEAHTPTATLIDRYETFPPNGSASTGTTLVNGKGYSAFVRFTGAITTDLTGGVRQGPAGVNVTNTGGGSNDGYNLIGNPYLSPIHWDNVTIPGTVDAQIAYKDNTNNIGTGAGNFVYFTQGSPGSGTGPGIIPSGQAFFVRVNTIGTSTITFQENDKVTTSAPQFVRTATIENLLRARIVGSGKSDDLIIRLADGAKDGADSRYDAYKLKNDFLSFSSTATDGVKMAINGAEKFAANQFGARKIFPLNIEGNGSTTSPYTPIGSFTMSFSGIETFDTNVKIILMDNYLKDSLVFSEQSSSYSFIITNDVKTVNNRFQLIIARTDIITGDISPASIDLITIYPNPTDGIFTIQVPNDVSGVVKTLNALGVEIGEVQMTELGKSLSGQFDLRAQPAGLYASYGWQ
jgi:hypothetical protein